MDEYISAFAGRVERREPQETRKSADPFRRHDGDITGCVDGMLTVHGN